jgi:hypothetical protein
MEEIIKSLFQHPFFRGIVEPEDSEYREKMEAIKKEQAELHRRLDELLAIATLDGEEKWMLTLRKKGDSCDG